MGRRSSHRQKDQEAFPQDLGTVQLPDEEVQRKDNLDRRREGGHWQKDWLVCLSREQMELGRKEKTRFAHPTQSLRENFI